MKLSLCMAVRNEEKFIHYPLDLAYDFVDEIIIVDGESDDKTVEIAKSYGKKVKVIAAHNEKMFHKNKQKAIEAATGDWILQLDADEALSPQLRDEILAIVNSNPKTLNSKQISNLSRVSSLEFRVSTPVAYWIPRKNFFLGRFLTKGGVYPDYTIRLYRKGTAHFPCKTVHENVDVSGVVGHLKNDLLHYADPDFERYLMRWNRYNELDADELKNKLQVPSSKFQVLLGVDYLIIKPIKTFFSMYLRHKGFMDSWQGFVFALFSALRFQAIYIKWWQKTQK